MQLPLIKLIAFLLPGKNSVSRAEDSRSPSGLSDCRGFVRTLASTLFTIAFISAGCTHKELLYSDDDELRCNVNIRLLANPNWEWSDMLLSQHIEAGELSPIWHRRYMLMVTDGNTGRVVAQRSDIKDDPRSSDYISVELPYDRPLNVYAWTDIVDEHGAELDYDCEKFPVVGYISGRRLRSSLFYSMTGYCGIRLTESSGDTTLNIPLHHHSGAFLLYCATADSLLGRADSVEAVIRYEGFHPVSFSIEQDAPADALPEQTVRCIPTIDSSGRMIVGADCVWLPQSEEIRQKYLRVSLYNAITGEWIGETAQLSIPLSRGVISVVGCEFHTDENPKGGIAIDPGFEGDINIRL